MTIYFTHKNTFQTMTISILMIYFTKLRRPATSDHYFRQCDNFVKLSLPPQWVRWLRCQPSLFTHMKVKTDRPTFHLQISEVSQPVYVTEDCSLLPL